jgi:hypothetical protein
LLTTSQAFLATPDDGHLCLPLWRCPSVRWLLRRPPKCAQFRRGTLLQKRSRNRRSVSWVQIQHCKVPLDDYPCMCPTGGCVPCDASAGVAVASADLASCRGMPVATCPAAGAPAMQALPLPPPSGSCIAAGAACNRTSCYVRTMAKTSRQANQALMLQTSCGEIKHALHVTSFT